MATQKSAFPQRALEMGKRLWHRYLLHGSVEDIEDILDYLVDDLVIVGTGRHEMYQSKEAFGLGFMAERAEVGGTEFEIIDEWYEVQSITDDVCMVYGTVWIREKESVGKHIFVEMGSRFTMTCRETAEGMKIYNVHQSIPYVDQADGEYYPKTLSLVAEEALEKNRHLERRVELDAMTELLNRMHMELRVTEALREQSGTFFMLDLDDFKTVNDTLGHVAGDEVIRAFADLMRQCFGGEGILGRLGGDEFAVWLAGEDRPEVDRLAGQVLAGCQDISRRFGIPFSCSIGLAHGTQGRAEFNDLYRRADGALYRAKRGKKGTICWEKS